MLEPWYPPLVLRRCSVGCCLDRPLTCTDEYVSFFTVFDLILLMLGVRGHLLVCVLCVFCWIFMAQAVKKSHAMV